jgi:hypothetical protein
MATDRKPVMVYLDEETLKWLDKYCWTAGYRRTDKVTGKTESRLGTGLLKIVRIYLSKYWDTGVVEIDDALRLESRNNNAELTGLETRIAALEDLIESQQKDDRSLPKTAECLDRDDTPFGGGSMSIESIVLESESEILKQESIILIPESEVLESGPIVPRWLDPIVSHNDLKWEINPKTGRYKEAKWAIEEYYPDYSFRGWIGGKSGVVESLSEAQTYGRKNDAKRKCEKLNALSEIRIFKIIPVLA